MPPSRFFRECIRSALRPKPKSGKLGNMATVNMLRFTHHDANVIAALAQFPGSPEEMKKKRLASLEEEDARLVGEVLVSGTTRRCLPQCRPPSTSIAPG